jgi:hypothetical protein
VIYDPSLDGWGEYDGINHQVKVGTLETPGLQLAVLHELLHAIDDLFNIRLSEQSIRCLEQALASLVHDNPKETLAWVTSLHASVSTRLRSQPQLPHQSQSGPEDRELPKGLQETPGETQATPEPRYDAPE